MMHDFCVRVQEQWQRKRHCSHTRCVSYAHQSQNVPLCVTFPNRIVKDLVILCTAKINALTSSVSLLSRRHDYRHELRLKSNALTLRAKVFTNLENPDGWYAEQVLRGLRFKERQNRFKNMRGF